MLDRTTYENIARRVTGLRTPPIGPKLATIIVIDKLTATSEQLQRERETTGARHGFLQPNELAVPLSRICLRSRSGKATSEFSSNNRVEYPQVHSSSFSLRVTICEREREKENIY